MNKAIHPRYDAERLYVSRKEGGRGLSSIEDSVDASIQRLEHYIESTEKDWLQGPESIMTTWRPTER